MKLQRAWMLTVALLLVTATPGYSAESDAEQEAAIAAIKKLGGIVVVDEKRPGKPVVEVGLFFSHVADADLVHLKKMSQLQRLDLPDRIGDAGLVHLTGLTELQTLQLGSSEVTDAGLEHVKGLTNLP